ncbi:DUF7931 domain-containing protein [Stutzerimonas chloritidismutans]|uniref:DUF7931 domain-containing protein n=1 Tax=Stutzerimonas chloritidismutans TaxID=203192 RepID=UPI003F136815
MSGGDPDRSEDTSDLPAIEFDSPGRFPRGATLPASAPASALADRSAERHPFETAEQARHHALSLMQQARRNLALYSTDLESWLYSRVEIQQACARLLRAHPRNRMRILLADSSRAIRESHRLLALSRRLTSNLHIRRLNPDYPIEQSTFLIVDEQGVLIRPSPELFAGYAVYQDAARARQRQQMFDSAWAHSLPDPDLRSFLL